MICTDLTAGAAAARTSASPLPLDEKSNFLQLNEDTNVRLDGDFACRRAPSCPEKQSPWERSNAERNNGDERERSHF